MIMTIIETKREAGRAIPPGWELMEQEKPLRGTGEPFPAPHFHHGEPQGEEKQESGLSLQNVSFGIEKKQKTKNKN